MNELHIVKVLISSQDALDVAGSRSMQDVYHRCELLLLTSDLVIQQLGHVREGSLVRLSSVIEIFSLQSHDLNTVLYYCN